MQPADFNSYGSRRGNDDVMVRGTFANIRIKNLMLGGEEGGNTLYFGSARRREKMAIYDAAMKYKADGVPLVVFAGKEYGTGSSRDWAAKGTNLLGVKAVVAESFERIHRSNLVGMGVLPLQFKDGENAQTLGLDGIGDLRHHRPQRRRAQDRDRDRAPSADGSEKRFEVQGAAADAEGSRVLPPRRHPALRAAPAGGEEGGVTAGTRSPLAQSATAFGGTRTDGSQRAASAVRGCRTPSRARIEEVTQLQLRLPARAGQSATRRPRSRQPVSTVVDLRRCRAADRRRRRSARR